MKIVFATAHFGFVRNFEAAIRCLDSRGHEIVLCADRKDRLGGGRIVSRLESACSGLRVVRAPRRARNGWNALGRSLRLWLDYLRYLEPEYDDAARLRARARQQVPGWVARASGLPLLRTRAGRRRLARLLAAAEASLPADKAVEAFVAEQAPDLLMVTPLLYFGSDQVAYVRAARKLRIPSLLGVGSWDHLTTKGLIHEPPDRVIVWNEMQRSEARRWHGIPRHRVIVAGAHSYDHWFDRRPGSTPADFKRRVGLDPERRFLLYLCSSPFIAPEETRFVSQWLIRLRASGIDALERVGVLIRPHPQNAAQWQRFGLDPDDNSAIYPAAGANPIDDASRADYFDSMFHSAGVVGLNTSGLIESGIVGKDVFTTLEHGFTGTQDGTLHFRHLREVSGGLVRVAPTIAEHLRDLEAVVDGSGGASERSRRFVETFVRPRGIGRSAAEHFADGVEETVAAGAGAIEPRRRAAWAARAALYPIAWAAARSVSKKRQKAARPAP